MSFWLDPHEVIDSFYTGKPYLQIGPTESMSDDIVIESQSIRQEQAS